MSKTRKILLAFGLALISMKFITIYWHIRTDYQGIKDFDLFLEGFPQPYICYHGIVSVIGNSLDTMFNWTHYLIDIAFYFLVWYGIILLITKFYRPKQQTVLKVITMTIFIGALLFEVWCQILFNAGDRHPWYDENKSQLIENSIHKLF